MFRFNGISAKEMGVIVDEMDFNTKAQRSYESTSIDGLHGALIDIGSYQNVTGSFNITLMKDNVDEVVAWLNGKGKLVFKDRETTIYILDQVDYSRLGHVKSASINYIRSPFWIKADDTYSRVTASVIHNAGNMTASPLVKVCKGSNYTEIVTINDVEFKLSFEGVDTIILDCASKTEVDSEGNSVSHLVEIGYEYPQLVPGNNTITVAGDSVVWIRDKECWL